MPADIYALCDYVIPNETEAAALTGLPVDTEEQARKAGDALLAKGAKNALITLGARGALLHNASGSVLIPSFSAGKVVETALGNPLDFIAEYQARFKVALRPGLPGEASVIGASTRTGACEAAFGSPRATLRAPSGASPG